MKHNNPTISQDMNRLLDLKGESTSEVADFIQPTIEISRFCNIARTATITNATSGVVYLTPADKDFYLSSVCVAYIKDVTATSTSMTFNVTIEGVERALISIPHITLTVGNGEVAHNFPIPIKVDRNTNIVLRSSTNVGNVLVSAAIQGYTVETTKGV